MRGRRCHVLICVSPWSQWQHQGHGEVEELWISSSGKGHGTPSYALLLLLPLAPSSRPPSSVTQCLPCTVKILVTMRSNDKSYCIQSAENGIAVMTLLLGCCACELTPWTSLGLGFPADNMGQLRQRCSEVLSHSDVAGVCVSTMRRFVERHIVFLFS